MEQTHSNQFVKYPKYQYVLRYDRTHVELLSQLFAQMGKLGGGCCSMASHGSHSSTTKLKHTHMLT